MPILPIGAAIMDTERIIPSHLNGGSPGSQQSGGQLSNGPGLFNGHHYQNSNPTTPIGHPHPGMNSIPRKKKTERMVPPINTSNYLNQSNGIYSNHVTPSNLMSPSNGGITNQAYTRDASVLTASGMGGRLNTTGDTTVSMHDDSDEQQEVIEVQILPQDENWGETATAVTAASDLDYGGLGPNSGFGQSISGNCQEMDKWRLETERGMNFRFRRHAGPFVAGLLSMLAFLSPILMAGLPKVGVLGLKTHQLVCGVECDGSLVSMAFKLFTLVVGSWAVFLRPTRSTLPRVRVYRALVCILILVFLVSFWLFYVNHIVNEVEVVTYKSLVSFAVQLVDALLFVHYLAVILLELRHRQPLYYVKIVRSPDGESRGFPIGQMSVQRAAAWVLDKYYTEFPIYNPYLDRVTSSRHRKGVKMYDFDGQSGINDGNSTVVSVASKRGSHNERFYEEYEYDKKLKKRRARLITAAEEAFTHIKRIQENQLINEKAPMESYEAAQSIFPTISRPLQKYLRVTRQQPRHTMESILQHLSTCLSFDMSPRAFLEKYLVTKPVLQIHKLPHFNLSEEIIDPLSNRFVLRLNSETSV